MTTRPCKYCGNSVASNAKRCPQCGGKKPYPTKPAEYAAGCGLLVAAFFAVSMCSKNDRADTLNSSRPMEPSGIKSNQTNERIQQLASEARRLRGDNLAMSAQGITDAQAFSKNDKRIVEILNEIKTLQSEQ